MKHTKGEWKVGTYVGITDMSLHTNETVYWQNVITTKKWHTYIIAKCLLKDKDELQANTKLIAAAPELLKALIKLQFRLEQLIGLIPTGESRNSITEDNINALLVIKNATE